jgi:hypothetical protein
MSERRYVPLLPLTPITGEFTVQLTDQQCADLIEAIPALAPICCLCMEPILADHPCRIIACVYANGSNPCAECGRTLTPRAAG